MNWAKAQAQAGNVVTPTQVNCSKLIFRLKNYLNNRMMKKIAKIKDQPSLTFTADDNALYTLIMSDPDAPSRQNPKNGEWYK